MGKLGFALGCWCALWASSVSAGVRDIDPSEIQKMLKGPGVVGWIHGSVADRQLFVFTFRDPKDFFNNAQFPLITEDAELLAKLGKLNRHDQVRIKGDFAGIHAPQKHILVQSIEMLKPWHGDQDVPPYEYQARIPKDLLGKTEIVTKVHAVDPDGRILVVEFKDAIIPVYVSSAELTKNLHRGDDIRLHFVLRQNPGQPTHVSPDSRVPHPIEVLKRIEDVNQKPITLEGALVLFPKSPQITLDIFALQVQDPEGVTIEYTLVNFEDPQVFQQIRAKLAAIWAKNSTTMTNGRNKLINPQVRLRATGIGNVQAPNQANPQLLLDGPDAISQIGG